jgi:hypothetical protein
MAYVSARIDLCHSMSMYGEAINDIIKSARKTATI